MDPLLKVYPAKYWNDQVVMLGNWEGIIALRDAIDYSLQHRGTTTIAEVKETTEHTESYNLCVRLLSEDEIVTSWDKLPLHAEDMYLSSEEEKFLAQFAYSEEVDI